MLKKHSTKRQWDIQKDTRLYANVIAESMWAQCDEDGNQYQLLEAIVDHKLDKNASRRCRICIFSTNPLLYSKRFRLNMQVAPYDGR